MEAIEYIEEHYESFDTKEIPCLFSFSNEIIQRMHIEYIEMHEAIPDMKPELIDWTQLLIEVIDAILDYDFFVMDESNNAFVNFPAKRVW